MKHFSVFLVVALISFSVNAQQTEELFKSTLWLKKAPLDSIGLKRTGGNKYLQNFNHPIDFKLSVKQNYSSLVNKQSSIFFVYKTSEEQENDLVVLQSGPFKTIITSKKLISDKDEIFNKAKPEQGNIISHIFNRQSIVSRSKGKLSFSDLLFRDIEGKNVAYEAIYIPECVNEKEKNSIESYLSIKYGISLIGEKSYTNSAGDTLWNYKENEAYKNRITGIGRDDVLTLYQKQSGNSTKDGLYIGLGKITNTNDRNPSLLKDKTFLLWGDNGLKTSLKGKAGALTKMERMWRARKTSADIKKLTAQVIINKEEMQLSKGAGKDDFIWLVMDTVSSDRIDYNKSIYVKASAENDSLIVFNDVKWTNATTLFTFVKGPDFMVNYELAASGCNASEAGGKVNISIIGGTSPYNVEIASSNFSVQESTDDSFFTIENIKQGDYRIYITDAKRKTYSDNFIMNGFSGSDISIAKEWSLTEGGNVKISPDYDLGEDLAFEWMFDKKLLYKGKEFLADTPGDYILVVNNKQGCSMELPFRVIGLDLVSGQDESYIIYPNPSKPNQLFTIVGIPKEASHTTITITDMNGKIVIHKDLGVVKDFSYTDRLNQSAAYNVIITSGEKSHTSKLLIN